MTSVRTSIITKLWNILECSTVINVDTMTTVDIIIMFIHTSIGVLRRYHKLFAKKLAI